MNSIHASGTVRSQRSQHRAPTIADVARQANCSPMTVSRVINRDGNVRADTRQRVEEAVAALNYSPNRAARSLAGGGHIRLGLIYANPSAAYLSELLMGALREARVHDIQLIVENIDAGDGGRQTVEHMIAGGVDGILCPAPLCDDPGLMAYLDEQGVPAVTIGAGIPPAGHMAVTIDDYGAARDMTRHIIALGHRRIGFIIGNPEQSASGRRLDGYRDALAEAGLPLNPAYIVQGHFTYRSGLAATETLLDLAERPSAIFASNDDMAAAAVAVAHRRHLDVPTDLTVCGFDDTPIAGTIWPELTTVRQPIQAMSRAAIDLLLEKLRNRRGQRAESRAHLVLDYTLIPRDSDSGPRENPHRS